MYSIFIFYFLFYFLFFVLLWQQTNPLSLTLSILGHFRRQSCVFRNLTRGEGIHSVLVLLSCWAFGSNLLPKYVATLRTIPGWGHLAYFLTWWTILVLLCTVHLNTSRHSVRWRSGSQWTYMRRSRVQYPSMSLFIPSLILLLCWLYHHLSSTKLALLA